MKMSLTLTVAAAAASAFAYIPEPQPVKSAVEITALYYPGTEHMPEWDMVDQTLPHVKPLLGWYDEGNPEVIDWQIKWAVEHGISSFCVDWYWNRGEQRLDHWVKGFYKAKFRKYLKWYVMYANHNAPGSHSTEDQTRLSKWWIDHYFTTPEYYTIDGKPVVVMWDCPKLDRDFIAEAAAKGEKLAPGEGVKRAFAITERMAKAAGLKGVYWIDMYHGWSYAQEKVDFAKRIGCEAQMIYNFDSLSYFLASESRKPTDTRSSFSYDLVKAAVPKWWEMTSRDPAFPFWPIIPTGWNDLPRSFQRARVIKDRTPEKFLEVCRACRDFCEKKGFRRVVIAPVNEWQEGSYIEPNEEYGFGMYDALRDAFCEKPAAGWPKNVTPKDLGMGPYDYPKMFYSPVQSWTFDKTPEGWYRQPYGCQVTLCKNGALWFLTSRDDNFQIRQRTVPFAASKYGSFRLKMKVTLNPSFGLGRFKEKGAQMRLKWGTAANPIIRSDLSVDFEKSVVAAPVVADGEWHEYALDLTKAPDWTGDVNELWFEAVNARHAIVEIDWMKFDDALYAGFLNPPRESRAWTYWFLQNTVTDRKTIAEEYADIAALGFGGMLVTDSRGYWVDDEHLLVPEATVRWGSDEWIDLYAFAIREAAKNNLKFSLNVAASGGHLRGDADVGADNPKFLMCRSYLPGDAFEAPAIPHYRDVAVFAVKTAEKAARRDWANAGDGYYSMAASSGRRRDGGTHFETRKALEVRELKNAAEGATLGEGWTIVRFGSGTIKGQEVDIDVLDRTAVVRHLERVMGKLVAKVPDLVGRDKTFANLYNVSWEGAMPTWSATFERDFRASEGYDVRPLLPALAGFELAARPTNDLMRDFRHARGVMMKDHLYGAVCDWAHAHGMGAFSESGGPWVRNPQTFGECDQLGFLAANDFPQGEYWPLIENGKSPWTGHANANARYITKGIASAAHVYDLNIASAEAFTHMHRHWSVDPAFLKPTGDQAFADGINLLVWHTYTSSPAKYGIPGVEYFAGSHINRNVTWHGEFAPMVTYLSRCQHLLQAGRPVTDVAVLVGDRAYTHWGLSAVGGRKPGNGRFRNLVSDEMKVTVPAGYAFDIVNDDAIAKNPKLLGRYPVVFDARPGRDAPGTKTVDVKGLLPDVETASDYTWIHRRIDGVDAYFVAGEGRADLTFRAAAPSVEVWDAVTGLRTAADATKLADGRTKVALDLPVGGSAFVMFCPSGIGLKSALKSAAGMAVAGPWDVVFTYHPGIAALPPAPVRLDKLVDFTTREDLRHFAGTATYRTTFQTSQTSKPAKLSLGKVPTGLAHVYVNGTDCGTVWCAPWEADISAAVRDGVNQLEIRYVNNWYNRLVGDCALPEAERVTKSNLHYWNVERKPGQGINKWKTLPTVYSGYSSFDPLQSCGLLGPVMVRQP